MNEERWLDFDIIKERWNKYRLEDDSILKTRTILKRVRYTPTKNYMPYDVEMDFLIAIHANPALRGKANPNRLSNDEILKNVEVEDMQYHNLEHEPNEYMLDNGTKVVIHTDIANISRSSLREQYGNPVYSVFVNNTTRIKPVNPP